MSINVKDSPSKVDSNLIENYGFGLWDFCMCLQNLFISETGEKNIYYQSLTVREEIERLINLKKSLVKRLDSHQENVKILGKKTNSAKRYNLKPFFDEIDKEIEQINMHPVSWQSNWIKSHLKFHNRVAAIWAQVIKKDKNSLLKEIKNLGSIEISTKKIDWPIIADLIEWFKLRFKETKYSVFFDYENIVDPGVLRRQYYKYKDNQKNVIVGDTMSYMLPWKIFRVIRKNPPKWAKKVLPMFPKEFPSKMIKISKDKIETIDIRKQKGKKVYIIFPTGETLP